MKILVIALSGIGDALMFTPALKLLREEQPDAQIDTLVMYKGSEEILKPNPDLNDVLYFDFLKEGRTKSLKYIFKLRGKYNSSINVYPSNRKEYNLISYLIGARKRVSVEYKRDDSQNLGFLNNIRVPENDETHNVVTNIKLCEALLNKTVSAELPLQVYLSNEEKIFAEDYLLHNGIRGEDILVGFHPGCSTIKNHIKRRWEPEKFAALGNTLVENYNAKILIFGGPDESELKEEIKDKIKSGCAIVVATKNLMKSAAIMERCNVFVTNDSSQMHIAAALGVKTVAIIGPTNTNYIFPWKIEHKIVSLGLDCSPCFFYSPKPLFCSRDDVQFKCIKHLTVDMVYNALKEFL